jgi:hypothetical protein
MFVIPGVSVVATPSCVTPSAPAVDSLTGGMHTNPNAISPGTFSLVANLGRGKRTANKNVVTQALQAPSAPTLVDSWASFAE